LALLAFLAIKGHRVLRELLLQYPAHRVIRGRKVIKVLLQMCQDHKAHRAIRETKVTL
jgi:hypothetical protein